jgi:predicted lipid-binding transport protein (Tim44 family)
VITSRKSKISRTPSGVSLEVRTVENTCAGSPCSLLFHGIQLLVGLLSCHPQQQQTHKLSRVMSTSAPYLFSFKAPLKATPSPVETPAYNASAAPVPAAQAVVAAPQGRALFAPGIGKGFLKGARRHRRVIRDHYVSPPCKNDIRRLARRVRMLVALCLC